MSLTKFIRDIQSRFETIPAIGAWYYNLLPRRVLSKSETRIANQIAKKIRRGIILDLGSGTGYLSIEVAKRVPELQVYGIDVTREMVRIARGHGRGIENVQFKLGNATELPFEAESIDFVVSTGSLHHWKRPVKIFNECYRVLKNGKEAWIYDGCPDALREGVDKPKQEYGWLVSRILTKVMELHGFSKEEYRTRIKDILDQTKFKGHYRMELKDIWMKIILNK